MAPAVDMSPDSSARGRGLIRSFEPSLRPIAGILPPLHMVAIGSSAAEATQGAGLLGSTRAAGRPGSTAGTFHIQGELASAIARYKVLLFTLKALATAVTVALGC